MNIREHIVNKLIASGGFWSYDEKSVRENMSDEQLIETMSSSLLQLPESTRIIF